MERNKVKEVSNILHSKVDLLIQESTDAHRITESKYSKPYDTTNMFIKVNIYMCVCVCEE